MGLSLSWVVGWISAVNLGWFEIHAVMLHKKSFAFQILDVFLHVNWIDFVNDLTEILRDEVGRCTNGTVVRSSVGRP